MKINIEQAEEIVNNCTTTNKKNAIIQKQSLLEVIKQVESKRQIIKDYLIVVNIITRLYQQKKSSLEHLIHELVNREQTIDQGLVKISEQQATLENHQLQIKCKLDDIRARAEKYRDKKLKCEQHYHSVASVPILSVQSKKKYLKARDKNLEAEQQLSEIRAALDKCQEHLRLVSKSISAHHSEQDQVSTQRRGSIDTIKSTSQQLEFLQKGCEFWKGFDTYQAQVVLESATYLYELDLPLKKKRKEILDLDIDQVWIKTFLLSCFEYGDREIYGDKQWSPATIKIDFDCVLCQIPQLGWPRLIHNNTALACEFCYNNKTSSLPSKTSIIKQHDSKMKKIVSHFFSSHSTKINPIM